MESITIYGMMIGVVSKSQRKDGKLLITRAYLEESRMVEIKRGQFQPQINDT